MERKVAIVTGGSKGIGKQLIKGLAKKDYNVIITYNTNEELANNLKKEIIEKYKIDAFAIKCDLSKEEEILSLKEEILKKYNHIDILINNAALSMDNYIEEKTKDEFMKVLEVNVVGTFLLTKYLLNYMNDSVVVNVSSTDSIDTYSIVNIDYSASKAAINSITKTFALSYPNIKFISVLPNWTNTESIKEMNQEYLKDELKRIGQNELQDPTEVAINIINLIENNNIKSGEIIRIDGDKK